MLVAIFLAILVLSQLLIGLLIFLESRNTHKIEQRLFAVVVFAFMLWTASVSLLIPVDTATPTHDNVVYFDIVNRVSFVLSYAVITTVYLFSTYYPTRKPITLVRRLILAAGGVLTVTAVSPALSGEFGIGDGHVIYIYGSLASAITVFAVLVVVAIYVDQLKTLRKTHEARLRRQTLTLLSGVSLCILHAVMFVVVMPIFIGQQTWLYVIGYAAPYYVVVFVGYGLLRQGLLDIRLIVARSVAYFLTLAALVLGYVGLASIVATYFLGIPLSPGTLGVLSLTTALVAVSFQPLKARFDRVTSRLFFRDYYNAQDVLDQISSLLVGTVEMDKIKESSGAIIQGTLRPTHFRYLMRADRISREDDDLMAMLRESDLNIIEVDDLDPERGAPSLYGRLQDRGVVLAIRLRTNKEDLGFMLFGIRSSGAGYSTEDKRLLGVIADELAVGMQNALRFEEIKQFNVTLQEKIDEATRKLRKTNERLKILDQTKDDFISMASHQLRTPLTSVKGYVSMVLDGDSGKLNDAQKKMLTQAFLSSQRMVYLISDLLNVSRLKTGKFVIEPAESNLADVIEEEAEQLTETVKARGLELNYHKPEHFPTLMLDETKLRQVIMNFIDNAVYYTPTGGHIDIYLVERPDSIEFTVVDDGIGVPKHEQHHLFSKFYRAKNAKNARPDGTGLGIFMAKKVIIAQGGAVIFKSTEGKGSTFGFTFPKAKLLPANKA